MPQGSFERPLTGFRVIEIVAGPLAGIARHLLELGADVLRIEVTSRDAELPREGQVDRAALAHIAVNLGKRSVSCAASDLPALIATELAESVDLIIEDLSLDPALSPCLDVAALRAAHPALVVMTVSGFGLGNACSQWQWSDAVLHALSAELSRSGIAGNAPLLPPGEIALQCAVAHGAYCATLALYHAMATGRGDHLDFAALDAAVLALDPGYGIGGSATLGRPGHLLSPDRPVRGFLYPILPCADGEVRICLLAPRQWLGLFRMMGEPAQFADEKYLQTAERYKCPDLLPAIARFFADKPGKMLEDEGQSLGVPIAMVRDLGECLRADHIRERGVFADVQLPDGRLAPFPNGVMLIDGERAGPLHEPGPAPRPPSGNAPLTRPLQGLRVLDLGVIVVGAETSRLLADMGADVIKVESLAFPDGTRQSDTGAGMSVGFGTGHRNKRSLGLNLKSQDGKALFRRLVATADVLLANFKPGTLQSLGFAPETLLAINPALVIVESSAYGDTGPWSERMGYGPLVRAAAGLTRKWRYPASADGFCDSITIYPDHVAGRLGAMGAIALLIRRMRTGRGGRVAISQAEVMLSHLAVEIAGSALGLGGIEDTPDFPWGVWQASGDDNWCVISVRNDADWAALVSAIGDARLADPRYATREGRMAAREAIGAVIASWMRAQDAQEAMIHLQSFGVPAGRMLRVAEQPTFSHFQARRLFRTEKHPLLPEPYVTERAAIVSQALPEPDARPAPMMGEHTFAVMQEWLGLDPAELTRLAAEGVLETVPPQIQALLDQASAKEQTA